MNEPAQPPPWPYGSRSAQPTGRTPADASDPSVLPESASTAVFPSALGDGASARTAEFAVDEPTRALPPTVSWAPAAPPSDPGPTGAPSVSTPLMPPESPAGAAPPPGVAPPAGAAPLAGAVPPPDAAPPAGSGTERRVGASNGRRRTITLVVGAVVLVVAAFGAGVLTRQFGQGAEGTATTGPTASTASRDVPEEPTEDSAVAPEPDQQVDDPDDSSDSAPSTADSTQQEDGRHDDRPGVQTGDSDPRGDATEPAAPDPRGGAGGDHGSDRSPNDGGNDDDDDDGD